MHFDQKYIQLEKRLKRVIKILNCRLRESEKKNEGCSRKIDFLKKLMLRFTLPPYDQDNLIYQYEILGKANLNLKRQIKNIKFKIKKHVKILLKAIFESYTSIFNREYKE